MKKTLVFGDTHGRGLWKEATASNDFDRVIFIGDYFDSWDVGPELQIENFKDICRFQKDQNGAGKEVIMLIGNHDFHYLNKQAGGETYSGYSAAYASSIGYVLTEHLPYMQVCYDMEGILFSHAGLTKTWVSHLNLKDEDRVDEWVNKEFTSRLGVMKFRFNGTDPTGDNKTQGPFWVRPRSLQLDALDGYVQIVGHTTMKKIVESPNKQLWLIDAIQARQYLEITDMKIEVKELAPLTKRPRYEDF